VESTAKSGGLWSQLHTQVINYYTAELDLSKKVWVPTTVNASKS